MLSVRTRTTKGAPTSKNSHRCVTRGGSGNEGRDEIETPPVGSDDQRDGLHFRDNANQVQSHRGRGSDTRKKVSPVLISSIVCLVFISTPFCWDQSNPEIAPSFGWTADGTVFRHTGGITNLQGVPEVEGPGTFSGKRVHFRTYGNEQFAHSRRRIAQEANNTGWFATSAFMEPKDLSEEFTSKYKDVFSLDRGGGYWIWKLFVFEQTMNEMEEGDFLVYLDAGSQVNKNGEKRFYEYLNLVNESPYDMIGFQIPMQEYLWSTERLFLAFNVSLNTSIVQTGQYEGGTQVFQKGPHFRKWLALCKSIIEMDQLLITDTYNYETKKMRRAFNENRHDQSIMSIAKKILGCIILNGRQETKMARPDKPFHVMRLRE